MLLNSAILWRADKLGISYFVASTPCYAEGIRAFTMNSE